MDIPLSAAQPGDLVFCHSSGIVGKAIRLAERLRWRSGSEWNHVAWIDHWDAEAQTWIVGQATAGGVTNDQPIETLAGTTGKFVIVKCPGNQKRTLQFLRAQVGTSYGYLTIASILVTILTPKFVNVMASGSWICSAVAAEGIRFGGWLHEWPDIYQVTPAELRESLS